jgi:hypothetical protein
MSDAEIALEKFKESGKFRIAGIGNPIAPDFYRGLSEAMIALEKFKESGGFRIAGAGGASSATRSISGAFTDSQNEARLLAEAKAKADAAAAAASAAAAATTVIVNVAGTVTAQEDLEKAIQDAINKSRAAGNVDALAPRSWRGEV